MSDPLLRPETLAAMRAATARARPDTAAIVRPPTDVAWDNFDPRTAAATSSVSVMVLPPESGTVDAEDGRPVTLTPGRLALPPGADIQVRDYVRVGSRLFQVLSLVAGSLSYEAQRLVDVKEIN